MAAKAKRGEAGKGRGDAAGVGGGAGRAAAAVPELLAAATCDLVAVAFGALAGRGFGRGTACAEMVACAAIKMPAPTSVIKIRVGERSITVVSQAPHCRELLGGATCL